MFKETEDMSQFEIYKSAALENLEVMSRTSRGISDTSSSEIKPRLAQEGEKLAQKAEENFVKAVEFVWSKRDAQFLNPEEVGQFIEEVATKINDGLLQEGQSIWRTWETKFGQVAPFDIPKEIEKFYNKFWQLLNDPNTDPKKMAGWIEQELDGRIHPFADGCGRTARAISSFVLARHGQKLPKYRDREEYYREINKPTKEWIEYYRSLF